MGAAATEDSLGDWKCSNESEWMDGLDGWMVGRSLLREDNCIILQCHKSCSHNKKGTGKKTMKVVL